MGQMTEDRVTHLSTLQFSNSRDVAHLVRGTRRGTPGRTLCGVDRFGEDTPGWSVGGGVSGPGLTHTPCPGCLGTAQQEFAGLPVSGYVGGSEVAAALGVPRIR